MWEVFVVSGLDESWTCVAVRHCGQASWAEGVPHELWQRAEPATPSWGADGGDLDVD